MVYKRDHEVVKRRADLLCKYANAGWFEIIERLEFLEWEVQHLEDRALLDQGQMEREVFDKKYPLEERQQRYATQPRRII